MMPGQPEALRPADADKLRLLVESARVRLAYTYDRQFAVSLSGIRTLPHQIEAVYIKMLPQPRLRLLLADDPGAGKTIMAGLLIKELKLREAVERCLIVVPALAPLYDRPRSQFTRPSSLKCSFF
jgi:SNF2 family DNA or RNA helicase